MKIYRIFIAESIPSLNKGEVTILEGLMEAFKGFGAIQYTMVTQYPDVDGPRYSNRIHIIDLTKHCFLYGPAYYRSRVVKVFTSCLFLINHMLFLATFKILGKHALRIYKDELWEEYVHSDITIVGHDGSYGLGGDRAMPLFYTLLLPVFAKMMGKTVILPGGSIKVPENPRWLTERVYRYSLKRFDLITLRERVSYENFVNLNVQQERCYVTADLAFLMSPVSKAHAQELLRQEGIGELSRPLIGVVITREKASIALKCVNNPEESYRKHIGIIANAIDYLVENRNASVIFIPHCIGIGEDLDDRTVHKEIYHLCKNKGRIKVINTEYSAKELKGILGELDLFIGERLHAAINALTMKVPSIVISNESDQRLDIIKLMKQESSILYIGDLQEEILIEKAVQFLDGKENIQATLESNITEVKERAERNRSLIESLK